MTECWWTLYYHKKSRKYTISHNKISKGNAAFSQRTVRVNVLLAHKTLAHQIGRKKQR